MSRNYFLFWIIIAIAGLSAAAVASLIVFQFPASVNAGSFRYSIPARFVVDDRVETVFFAAFTDRRADSAAVRIPSPIGNERFLRGVFYGEARTDLSRRREADIKRLASLNLDRGEFGDWSVTYQPQVGQLRAYPPSFEAEGTWFLLGTIAANGAGPVILAQCIDKKRYKSIRNCTAFFSGEGYLFKIAFSEDELVDWVRIDSYLKNLALEWRVG